MSEDGSSRLDASRFLLSLIGGSGELPGDLQPVIQDLERELERVEVAKMTGRTEALFTEVERQAFVERDYLEELSRGGAFRLVAAMNRALDRDAGIPLPQSPSMLVAVNAYCEDLKVRIRELSELANSSPHPAKEIYFLLVLKHEFPNAYVSVVRAIDAGLAVVNGDYVDFRFEPGSIAHFLREGGFDRWNDLPSWATSKGSPLSEHIGKYASKEPPVAYEELKQSLERLTLSRVTPK